MQEQLVLFSEAVVQRASRSSFPAEYGIQLERRHAPDIFRAICFRSAPSARGNRFVVGRSILGDLPKCATH